MSLTQAVVCDGCGNTVAAIRNKPGDKHMIPIGWLRMPVWVRKNGETSRVGEVEICRSECSSFAVSKFFEASPDLSEPVEPKDPPPDAPGSGSHLDL
jgi:hypothetical protein